VRTVPPMAYALCSRNTIFIRRLMHYLPDGIDGVSEN
jgi:hypothetical protein